MPSYPVMIEHHLWLLAIREDPLPMAIVGQLFSLPNDQSQFTIFLTRAGAYSSRYTEILETLYSTTFWATDPSDLAAKISADFLRCVQQDSPIELVYSYGGTLSGGRVPLLSSFTWVH